MIEALDLALGERIACPSLAFAPATLVALVGPNGGGKTSLLRALAGVEGATGTLTLDGENRDTMTPARRAATMAFVPASRDMAWPIRVRDLVALGVPASRQPAVGPILEQFELTAFANRPSNQLSTGERARVLTARALASGARLLLLDEPLGNLDPYWALRFLDIVRAAAQAGTTVIAALHDLAHLPRFDRALLVADGRVQMDETPAALLDDERFLSAFRLARDPAGRMVINR